MRGLDWATQTSPRETVVSWSNWCSKVTPLLAVLSRPPEAVATQYVAGSASYTETATTRPPIEAGPIDRQVSPFTHAAADARAGGWGEPSGGAFGRAAG